jgi:tripartite-type tricarboxylate transporter receptor subunit TctC
MFRRNFFTALATVAALTTMPFHALAQSSGPMTLLVGYSAGGSADYAARVVASELSKKLGRSVIVENATGGSGMIALQKLVNGKPPRRFWSTPPQVF